MRTIGLQSLLLEACFAWHFASRAQGILDTSLSRDYLQLLLRETKQVYVINILLAKVKWFHEKKHSREVQLQFIIQM